MLLTLTYGAAILASSLLLFLVQPVLAKAILPWFGGSASVWTTAILFFQAFLLLGYLYAHLTARYLSARRQAWLHAGLLAASLACLPISASPAWNPGAATPPVARILAVLTRSVGFPYFLLAATGPLLQRWYVRSARAAIPYRLFAVSNLGSLTALLLYPFAIEPFLSVHHQLTGWSIAYAAVAALLAFVAILGTSRSTVDSTAPALSTVPAPSTAVTLPLNDRLRWIALAACPSALWLGVATELSQNVAPIPLLWILPLAIYLLSFILTFDRQGWYRPAAYRILLPLAWAILAVGASRLAALVSLPGAIVLLSLVLFACCMFCHGELAARKPDPSQLTGYYLMLSLGGALGGLFVGLLAPLIFNRYLELPVAVTACVLLALSLLYRLPNRRLVRLAVLSIAAFSVATWVGGRSQGDRLRVRNFYGALHITDTGSGDLLRRTLLNGPINHGSQFLTPQKSRIGSTYYGSESGAALAIRFPHTRPRRVGIVGLGAGTLAVYGERGDSYRFYELNPAVISLANTEFSYLRDCPCDVTVVPGDGRLALEREEPQNFDVLVVDAFNGDSIPVHLLTSQAFAAYLKHLRPEGVLAIHITNRYLDLTPVVAALSAERGRQARLVRNPADPDRDVYAATWFLSSTDGQFLSAIGPRSLPLPPSIPIRPWTDDYSAIFQILR
ncbi:MAG: fused MFS/spermidine synthase [Candidatus Solibacter sp.]